MRMALSFLALALLCVSRRQAWAQCVSDYAGLSGCLSGCVPTPAPITTVPTTTVAACMDVDANCEQWEKEGYCTSDEFTATMEDRCPVSCFACAKKLGCTDRHEPVSDCVAWKGEDLCLGGTGDAYVRTNCGNTCGDCAAALCVDNDKRCKAWERRGFCTTRADFLDINCPLSCKHNGC